MTETAFEEVCRVAFEGIQDPSQRKSLLNADYNPETVLTSAGINSVDLAEMVCTSEQHWGVEFTDAEVEGLHSLGDLHRLVCKKK